MDNKNLLSLICKLGSHAIQILFEKLIFYITNRTKSLSYHNIILRFAVPNQLCKYRVETFSSKEPETLSWIDSFPEGSIFWDIGANIGLYSLYAAKQKGCRVFSFEPSVFNLEVLARNIFLNDLAPYIAIVPFAAGDKTGTGLLHMTSTAWGGALSTFDKIYGYDGKNLNVIFEYTTCSVTLDDAVGTLGLPYPHYIKIDVDGIEHLILAGSYNVLRQAKQILIELPGVWKEQTLVAEKLLQGAGFKLSRNHNWDPVSNPLVSANQIWSR